MNKKLGWGPIIMGAVIVILGIIGSFFSWFIGGAMIVFGLWNLYVGWSIQKGQPIFMPSTTKTEDSKEKRSFK